MMVTSGPAKVLHIYVNSTDQWGGRPLYSAVIAKCHALGVAGATAFRSFEGYGAGHVLHTPRLLSLSENLPVRIEVVDGAEAIERLLTALDEMLGSALVTLSDTQVWRSPPGAAGTAR